MQPHTRLKLVVTLAALAIAVVHIWVPSITVDAITLALFVVAVLPWLQPIFKTIKLPGGFELTLQELKEEVKDAAGAAQSAERKAELAVAGLTSATKGRRHNHLVEQPRENLVELSHLYEAIREEQDSGPKRTQAMAEVVREMIEFADVLPDMDVLPMLRSDSAGQRLAAYAYLYARPDPALLNELVLSVTTREDTPFGQYWGLQAIGLNIGNLETSTQRDAVMRDLVAYSARVPSGSDRGYEVRRILEQIRRMA